MILTGFLRDFLRSRKEFAINATACSGITLRDDLGVAERDLLGCRCRVFVSKSGLVRLAGQHNLLLLAGRPSTRRVKHRKRRTSTVSTSEFEQP